MSDINVWITEINQVLITTEVEQEERELYNEW